MNDLEASHDPLGSLSEQKIRLLGLVREAQARQRQRIEPSARQLREGKECLPASWAQQRLWFIDQLEGGGAAYHIAISMTFKGTLDTAAVEKSLEALVRRHESLRTVFITIDGEPWQQFAHDGAFVLKQTDLRTLSEPERAKRFRDLQVKASHERFDLNQGPLIRGHLVRLGHVEHTLFLTMHHIVSDGWSMGVLTREFAEYYRRFHHGSDDALEALPIQYADYAQWQRQWLSDAELERQLAYWRETLSGAPTQLELPSDRPRPALQSYRGEDLKVGLSAPLTGRLRAFASQQDVTLYMLLYTGWAMLLAWLTGQDDIVIGTPVANRQRPELEGLIGLFVNTLALRVRVGEGDSIGQVLSNVKQATLSAYAHQDAPFEKVVETLHIERSLARNPIFQVMFVLQTAPKGVLDLPDLEVTVEDSPSRAAMFDVLVSLEERGEDVSGNLYYATDLFERESIERWWRCYISVLEQMTRNPRSRVADAWVLPEGDREHVVNRVNACELKVPAHRHVHELVEEQAECNSEVPALRYRGATLTYSELNRRTNQLARRLRSTGVGPDQIVGIFMQRGFEMVIGVLATLKAGGAYLPLDPNYPTERLRYMLQDAAPTVVLTQEEMRSALPSTWAAVVTVDANEARLDKDRSSNLDPREFGLSPENLLYVIYTSGSTGTPKGTAMPHRAMVNLLQWHRSSLPLRAGERVLQFAALSFDVAFQEIFSTLAMGGTLVLLDEWVRKDAQALTDLLCAERIERLFVPPMMLQTLAEQVSTGTEFPRTLRDVIAAGEQLRISPEIVGLFHKLNNARLHNHYGPTETHVVTALTLEGSPDRWPALPPIGRPVANLQMYVLDSRGRPVPFGVRGEIYIGGTGVARGYLHRPTLTEERFLKDPFSAAPGARLYKTGDVGRWRADGNLEYLGRNDDQVKIRGYRVELGEIEAQLGRHASVREVAVVAREDTPGLKRLVAYLTWRTEASAEDLRAHLRGALPEFMIPTVFVPLERMPLTPSGKLDRRALPKPQLDLSGERATDPPRGQTEEVLAAIWESLLQVAPVGRADNFFELGGHSLLGMKLMAQITQRFSVRLSVVSAFQFPTITQMAQAIDALRSRAPAVQSAVGAAYSEGVI